RAPLIPRRFEMIRHNQDEVRAIVAGHRPQRSARRGAGAPKRVTAQPGERPFKFVEKAGCSRLRHLILVIIQATVPTALRSSFSRRCGWSLAPEIVAGLRART